MPTEPPDRVKIAVLMPIAWPRPLMSGPPLFPGLMDASVWMKSSYGPSPITRPVALTRDDRADHALIGTAQQLGVDEVARGGDERQQAPREHARQRQGKHDRAECAPRAAV